MDRDSPIRTRISQLARVADERVVRALARRPARRRPRGGKVLVVAPANEGSIGDEAMIQAIASHLRAAGARQVGLLGFSSRAEWAALADVDRHERLPGGLVHFGLAERAALARVAHDYDAAVLIGADVLDGYYSVAKSRRRLAIAESLASWGLHVCIAGFSLNERVDPACHADLRRLAGKAVLYLRDPVSLARLDVPGTGKQLTADAAFLLVPRATSETEHELVAELSAARDRGAEFFACNLNEQVYAGAAPDVIERHLQAVAAAVAALSASDLRVRV
jgi:polysaccharide pyruvyl transferase WcaK-like protein